MTLSLKLVLTLTIVLGCAMAAAAFFNYRTLTRYADLEAAWRRTLIEQDVHEDLTLITRTLSPSVALPLAEGNFTYLDALVASAAKQDARILWILISDAGSNRVVARSPGAPAGQTWSDGLTGPIATGSATEVLSSPDRADPTLLTFGAQVVAGDRVIGQLRIGVTTAELEKEIEATVAQGRLEARRSITQTLVAAALFLLARPLRDLSRQAHRIADGDLGTRVAVRGRDEIGQLGTSFNFMADRLGALLAETANRASLEKEMSLARDIQASMNPPRELQEIGPFRVVGTCDPAATCGGDWWMVRPLPRDRLLVIVGDVTGHGIPSAMVAATACGAAWSLSLVDGDHNAEAVLRAIDGAIRGVGAQKLLMTCFAAIIDPHLGTVEYSNAGHNFPYVVPAANGGARRELAVLALRGSPLGNRPGDFVLGSGVRKLAAGDVLVFFTDGIVERIDDGGERFGDRRLRVRLAETGVGAHGQGLAALRDGILVDVTAFGRGAAPDDDMTIVLVQHDPAVAAPRGDSA
jgi:phosphoserine phosphatase RsbU/P